MLIREIENRMSGTKWGIYKNGENDYSIKYSELYAGQWKEISEESEYTKEAIETVFDIKIA